MLCPVRMLGDAAPYWWRARIASEHVECGGLPPLFAVPACRDVLQDRSIRKNRRLPRRGLRVRGLLGSGEASFARRQRRQGAALQIPGADGRFNLVGCITPSKFAGRSVLRPYKTTGGASVAAIHQPRITNHGFSA
jgi:hypothetical protein